MHNKLIEALGYIGDAHIAEAAAPRKRKRALPWLGAIAAVAALAILISSVGNPALLRVQAISLAVHPEFWVRPERDDYTSFEEYRAVLDQLDAESQEKDNAIAEAKLQLAEFFKNSNAEFLTDDPSENAIYSPINLYISLSMLAEITGNHSREQILEILNTGDTGQLREQTALLWESVYYGYSPYRKDKHNFSILANSLWLDEGYAYDQTTMDALSQYHYASVYQEDLDSKQAERALAAWINQQTGNLVKGNADQLSFPPESVLALASTVHFQAKWEDDFSALRNKQAAFHAPEGDITCTFMNKKEEQMNYYWGESFGAVSLALKNGSRMWLFLPDPDKTPEDVLAEGEYLDLIMKSSEETAAQTKYMKVNLSVPKFDINVQADLKAGLQALGVTDVFSLQNADFSAITGDTPVYLTAVEQATRVAIDEDGVTAASYVVPIGAGAAAPPEEIIDFVLDRPFVFVIASNYGLPLFAGTVNHP